MQSRQRESLNKVQIVFAEVNVDFCESQAAAGKMACQQFLFNNTSPQTDGRGHGGLWWHLACVPFVTWTWDEKQGELTKCEKGVFINLAGQRRGNSNVQSKGVDVPLCVHLRMFASRYELLCHACISQGCM